MYQCCRAVTVAHISKDVFSMRYYATALVVLAVAGAALAIAPPQNPPTIIPSPPPTTGVGPVGPPVNPPPTPEPATLTIALVSAAAAGSFRLLRRKW
jgi:hypothetical protein